MPFRARGPLPCTLQESGQPGGRARPGVGQAGLALSPAHREPGSSLTYKRPLRAPRGRGGLTFGPLLGAADHTTHRRRLPLPRLRDTVGCQRPQAAVAGGGGGEYSQGTSLAPTGVTAPGHQAPLRRLTRPTEEHAEDLGTSEEGPALPMPGGPPRGWRQGTSHWNLNSRLHRPRGHFHVTVS